LGLTPPVGGGDSEKAQLPLLNRVILNRYRTEKYFLPEESYFILGLMYFLRAPPKSVPVCPPHQGWSRGVEGWLQVVYRHLTRVRYGSTDLRGKPGGRGRARRTPPNQVTAGN
jgi:hypothetical protein